MLTIMRSYSAAVFVLVLVLWPWFPGQCQAVPANQQQKSAQQAGGGTDPSGIAQQLTPVAHEEKSAQNKKEAAADPPRDWPMLILTGVLAAANIAYVWVNWHIMATVKKQSAALINSDRAWLLVDATWTPGYAEITSNGHESGVYSATTYASIRLLIVNDGGTPAWVDDITAKLVVVKRRGALPAIAPGECVEVAGPAPIQMKTPEEFDIPLKVSGFAGLGEENVAYGIVRYRDVFSENRSTTFAFVLSGSQIVRLRGNPDWNTNT